MDFPGIHCLWGNSKKNHSCSQESFHNFHAHFRNIHLFLPTLLIFILYEYRFEKDMRTCNTSSLVITRSWLHVCFDFLGMPPTEYLTSAMFCSSVIVLFLSILALEYSPLQSHPSELYNPHNNHWKGKVLTMKMFSKLDLYTDIWFCCKMILTKCLPEVPWAFCSNKRRMTFFFLQSALVIMM